MYDTEEEGGRMPHERRDLSLPHVPPLLLAGIDEDDTWEPHVVRGID
ncbi:hypothetical protein [Streptomyces sp. GESEQ-4]|jgi:hypothetical protein|nr:hypothetical protein [Streptomyces sp. GESEQ-4]